MKHFYIFSIVVILSLNSQFFFSFSFSIQVHSSIVFGILGSLRRWKLVWVDVSIICCLLWYQPLCQFRPSASCAKITGELLDPSPDLLHSTVNTVQSELAEFKMLLWWTLTPWVICWWPLWRKGSFPFRASIMSLPLLLPPPVLCLPASLPTLLSDLPNFRQSLEFLKLL